MNENTRPPGMTDEDVLSLAREHCPSYLQNPVQSFLFNQIQLLSFLRAFEAKVREDVKNEH